MDSNRSHFHIEKLSDLTNTLGLWKVDNWQLCVQCLNSANPLLIGQILLETTDDSNFVCHICNLLFLCGIDHENNHNPILIDYLDKESGKYKRETTCSACFYALQNIWFDPLSYNGYLRKDIPDIEKEARLLDILENMFDQFDIPLIEIMIDYVGYIQYRYIKIETLD